MSAFGQAGFGSKNRQNQLRSQGQMDPFGQQVRQAMQPPTLNIYQAPQATVQAQTGGTAQPAPAVNMTAQTGGTFPTKPVTPGTAQPIQPQSQGTQYASDPTYASRVASAAQEWNSTPAGSQQRDWVGNTMSKMPPELAAQWQSMQSGQGGLGAGGDTMPPGTANPFGYYYNSRGERFHGEVFNPGSAYRMDDSGRLVPYMNGQGGGQPAATMTGQTGGTLQTKPVTPGPFGNGADEFGNLDTRLVTGPFGDFIMPMLSQWEIADQVRAMPIPETELERESRSRWFVALPADIQGRFRSNPDQEAEAWQQAWSIKGPEAIANWQNDQVRAIGERQARDAYNLHLRARKSDPRIVAMQPEDFDRLEFGRDDGWVDVGGPFRASGISITPGAAQPIQPQSQGTPYGDWSASMQGAWQQATQDQELKRIGRDQLGMKPPTLSPGDMSISDWQSQRSGMDATYLQQVRDEMARRGMQPPQVQLPVGMVIDGNGNWSPDWSRLQSEQDYEMKKWLGGDRSAANPWS